MKYIKHASPIASVLLACGILFASSIAHADHAKAKSAHEQKDYSTALKEVSACAGLDQKCDALLGIMYVNGQGVPKDENKAFELFKQAAKEGLHNHR